MWIPRVYDREIMEKIARVIGIKIEGKTDVELESEIKEWMVVRARAWGELGVWGQD